MSALITNERSSYLEHRVEVKKGENVMRNGYEVPEFHNLGRAQNMILGQKPEALSNDYILGAAYRQMTMDDIDESDE